jgi:hypothetical protein
VSVVAGSLGGRIGLPFRSERLPQGFACAREECPRSNVADAKGSGKLEPGHVVELG